MAAAGEADPGDFATMYDRVQKSQGRPQRYGSQFSFRQGHLVADSIADMKALDSLRAAVGLPPMHEYAKMLGEAYKTPVTWPPAKR